MNNAESEWPTATDLVNFMRGVISEELAEGNPVPELDGLLDYADTLFPNIPEDDSKRDAFHARAVAIMDEAKATMVQILPAFLPSAEEDIIMMQEAVHEWLTKRVIIEEECYVCGKHITEADEDRGQVFMDNGTGPGVDVCSDKCGDAFYNVDEDLWEEFPKA